MIAYCSEFESTTVRASDVSSIFKLVWITDDEIPAVPASIRLSLQHKKCATFDFVRHLQVSKYALI